VEAKARDTMSGKLLLTQSQKAAAVLVAMGKPAAARLLKFFKQDELKALIEAARTLRTIPQSELERIVAEFEAEFTEGAGLLDSGDKMDTLLSESLTAEEMQSLLDRDKPVGEVEAPSIWPSLEALDPQRLIGLVGEEHPQTIAYVFSRLPTSSAARALVLLDRAMRGEVVKRMLALAPVKGPSGLMLENHLRVRLMAESAGKDTSEGQVRVAGVLNELGKGELEEVMGDLEAAGTADLQAIRARLFSFEDILFIAPKSRVSLFDGLGSDLVTLALRGSTPEMREAVLSALGQRSRRMIEAELASAVEVAADEVDRARRQIASIALRQSAEGTLDLTLVAQAVDKAA
jgi:flagellar motor switch protein FliG